MTRSNQEIMPVWVTAECLTKGIIQIYVRIDIDGLAIPADITQSPYFRLKMGRDAFVQYSDAQERADKLRKKKIVSLRKQIMTLEKQIRKFESLTF